MKKNQVNEKFVDETKRKNLIVSYFCLIFIIFIISLSFALIYINKNKDYYINYDEKSLIDYNVYLKENEFFENNYLESDNQYIASLINYIDANFKYKLDFEESNVNFKYSYRIEAIVNVEERSNQKSLYKFGEDLLEQNEQIANSSTKLLINEQIKIDYNTYNDKIKKFINLYGLDEINSTLSINMYITVDGSCDEFKEDTNNESVMTLTIPLTTKTVGIDISNNLVNSQDNVMVCKDNNPLTILFLIFSMLLLVVDIMIITKLIKYIESTRSAESKYEKELKKILYNYHSYIQEMNNAFDLTDYKLIDIKTFNDMLEIRDTENKPILMTSSKEKKTTYFIIPTNTNLLYVYRLKVSDMEMY